MSNHLAGSWIAFSDRLPDRDDADTRGMVMLKESNGNERRGLYNWIPTSTPHGTIATASYWHANGFTHWRRLTMREAQQWKGDSCL